MSSAEWLTGRDARNLLLSVGPLDARIGAKLFRLAADGMVRTRAKVVFVNETAQSRDVDISATLWAQLLTGAPIREDWVLSSFAGRRARRLLDEDDVVRLGGVTFSAIDLKASLGLEVIETDTASTAELAKAPRGFQRADAGLVEEMHRLFDSGEEPSLLRAATLLASTAQGNGTLESKRDRIYKRRRRGT